MIKAHVRNGADNLDKIDGVLKGKRVGFIGGDASITRDGIPALEILAKNYNLTALFGAEHGVRGDLQAGAKVDTYTDPKLGIPVYSIYGGDNRPTEEMLKDIDVLVIDYQDATARFYTYLFTTANTMIVCAGLGIPVVILDKVTPLGGVEVSGTICDPNIHSFVGDYELPTRIGLTMGEYARYVNDYLKLNCDLTVAPITGWKRDMYFDQTDLPFVAPSPNLPTVDSCFAFVGTCVFEGTNLSEGRGTTRPFELVGAPWLDTEKLVENMAARGHEGAILRRTYFTPKFSKHQDELCNGVQIHVTNREKCDMFRLGLYLLEEIWKLHPDKITFRDRNSSQKTTYHLDLILGTEDFRLQRKDADAVIADNQAGIEAFRKNKVKYHLYE